MFSQIASQIQKTPIQVPRKYKIVPFHSTLTLEAKSARNVCNAIFQTLILHLQPREESVSPCFERRGLQRSTVGSVHSVDVVDVKPAITVMPTTPKPVILQPIVLQDESLMSPTVIGGHQYTTPTVLVNQTVCSSTSAKVKPKQEVDRLPSPTSVSLVTTITSTRLTTTTTNNSSSIICNSSASSPSSEQIKPSAR